MSDLRTRIKHAIDQAHASSKPHSTYDDWLTFAADAVIRELGLHQERIDHVLDGLPCDRPRPAHRYVTEWEADE